MKQSGFLAAALAGLLVGIAGCGGDQYPAYSTSLKYGVRQDPIINTTGAKLGDERYEPDTPGQLPIMRFDDIFKPGNPMEPKAEELKKINGLLDPRKLSDSDRKQLEDALEATFGTPAEPKVTGVDKETIDVLKLDDESLRNGSKRYRVHCLHCHGASGDGRGPTAKWINPHPRDFRMGIFKFQSVNQLASKVGAPFKFSAATRKPNRSDLMRTLRSGIEGTAMPTFNLLDDKELEWIISYVIHLSIRGEVEQDVLKETFSWSGDSVKFKAATEEDDPKTIAEAVKQQTVYKAQQSYLPARDGSWKFSQKKELTITPGPYPDKYKDEKELAASVQRGKILFVGDTKAAAAKVTCVSCHTDFGRQARFRFDDWGTLVRPNNFPNGIFRGGRRPIDMYYRIHSGINGSGMANFGDALEPNEIWDLINFVSILSYPAMQEKMGVKLN
jgi:mono/diheme cytochrome c family protein